MFLLYLGLYAHNYNKHRNDAGTKRAIWLSQSFSRNR